MKMYVSETDSKYKKIFSVSVRAGARKKATRVLALALTLALFSVPRTDKSCNQLISICYLKVHKYLNT